MAHSDMILAHVGNGECEKFTQSKPCKQAAFNQWAELRLCGRDQSFAFFEAQEPGLRLIHVSKGPETSPGSVITDTLVVERMIQGRPQDRPYPVGACPRAP